MPIKACQGCLKDQFLTTTEAIDCFTGQMLFLWGEGQYCRLGTSVNTDYSSPVQTITRGTNWRSVSAGGPVTAAIKTDGRLWLWGDEGFGMLGNNNSVTPQSSPLQTISGGTDWKSVCVGKGLSSAVVAIKTDGTLWLWGRGCEGQLGDNTILVRQSPIQTISGGNNWKSASTGRCHTAAIKTDGTLWMFGRGNTGQLGTNDILDRSTPTQTFSGGTNWKQVSIGGTHSVAIKTDGSLWSWGSFGAIMGNELTVNQSSPVQTVSAGTNWRSVSAGSGHTAAIKTDGSLWLWGYGGDGRLGNSSVITRSSPVQTVSAGTNWRSVSGGGSITAAIKTDGSLWLWGNSFYGLLGNNGNVFGGDVSSPVQTVSGGNNWMSVSAGLQHTAATCIVEF